MLEGAFCRQIDLYSTAETAVLREFLEQQGEEDFFFEHRYRRRGLVKQLPEDYRFVLHWNSWFPVEFDGEGKILSERVTEVYRNYPGYERVHAIFYRAMEAMAQQLGWNSSTQLMGITIMQHPHLKKGESTALIDWHPDAGTHSLVALMDDHTAWEGGEFLFKIGEGEVETFIPREGKAVFFCNEGTKHCVLPLTAKSDLINRTILTVHRKKKIDAKIA